MPRPKPILPVGLCVCRDPNCTTPFGYCHCGWCGQKTPLAKQSSTARGWITGLPCPFVYGHRKITREVIEQPSDSSIRHLALNKGYTIVDVDDFERFGKFTYHRNAAGYPSRHLSENKHVMLHREIIEAPEDIDVDHIDGDPNNNRKSNLRLCTPSQNSWNRKLFSSNTSGHTGVYLNKKTGNWYAMIMVGGKFIRLGTFKEKADAFLARRAAELLYYGEYAPKRPR